MKAYVTKAAVLVFLGGIALSASAKPVHVMSWQNAMSAGHQNSYLMVAARGGLAGTTLGPKKDVAISVAKP